MSDPDEAAVGVASASHGADVNGPGEPALYALR